MGHATQTQTATSTRTAVIAAVAVVAATVVGTVVGFSQWQANKAVIVSDLNLNINSPIGEAVVLRGSGEAGSTYGFALANVGDLNGDSYDDLVVTDSDAGKVYGYFGAMTIDAVADWEVDSELSEFGYSVDGAGDVNGDGFADVIVGARSEGDDAQGMAVVYYGSATGPRTDAADWSVSGSDTDQYFGQTVSGVGDLNGDGYDDVAIFTGNANDASEDSKVSVYYGSSSGLPTTADWIYTNSEGYYERSINLAGGDVNGDGYNDLVVGNPEISTSRGYGSIMVFHGSASGLTSLRPNFVASTTSPEDFGGTLASATDLDGDGYDDVIVGAPTHSNGEDTEGAIYAYYGSATGLSRLRTKVESNKEQAWMGLAATATNSPNTNSEVIVSAPGFESYYGARDGRVYAYYHSFSTGRLQLDGTTAASVYPGMDVMGVQVAASHSFVGEQEELDIVIAAASYDDGSASGPAVLLYQDVSF